jgi:hypothetical protein
VYVASEVVPMVDCTKGSPADVWRLPEARMIKSR